MPERMTHRLCEATFQTFQRSCEVLVLRDGHTQSLQGTGPVQLTSESPHGGTGSTVVPEQHPRKSSLQVKTSCNHSV